MEGEAVAPERLEVDPSLLGRAGKRAPTLAIVLRHREERLRIDEADALAVDADRAHDGLEVVADLRVDEHACGFRGADQEPREGEKKHGA